MTEAKSACPSCNSPGEVTNFTWRGGYFGTRLLGIARCKSCRKLYCHSTRKDANTPLWLWLAGNTMLAVAAGIIAFMFISGKL